MVNAVVLGASGFVGRRLVSQLGARGVGTFASRPTPGGVAFDARRQGFADILPDLPTGLSHVFILYGAINPELCARDWDATAALNIDSIKATAETCFREGLTPVFFSTDYVFPGDRGFWTEEDATRPLTAYGRQKAIVEAWFREQRDPWVVARLSKVVSGQVEPQNILGEWVRNVLDGATMRCARDQVLSPLDADDAAGAVLKLAGAGATGLFNVAGPEAFTRLALLRLVLARLAAVAPERTAKVEPCLLADLPFSEPRPVDTSLNIEKLQREVGWDFTPMSTLATTLAAAGAAA